MPPHLRLVRASERVQRRMFLKALALGMAMPAALRLARTATAANAAAQTLPHEKARRPKMALTP